MSVDPLVVDRCRILVGPVPALHRCRLPAAHPGDCVDAIDWMLRGRTHPAAAATDATPVMQLGLQDSLERDRCRFPRHSGALATPDLWPA